MRFFADKKSCEAKGQRCHTARYLSAVVSFLLLIKTTAAQEFNADEFCANREVARYVFGTTCQQYVYCYPSFDDNTVKGSLITCPFKTLFNPVTGDCTWKLICNPEPTKALATKESSPTTTTERKITPPDETITDPPPVDLVEFCSTKENKRYPFGTGCTQYVYCYKNVGMQGAMYYCAEPTLFNPAISNCAPPTSFQCTT